MTIDRDSLTVQLDRSASAIFGRITLRSRVIEATTIAMHA